jgi:hypothetical protein
MNRKECLTLTLKDFQERSKYGGDGGTGVYTTTSRVMAADRPYREFYDFHRASPEYFEHHLLDSALFHLRKAR